jgi:2-dehydro-3-deoxygluconokinase
MPVYMGGPELNVAQALAQWKVPVKYNTALPDHYLSKEIRDSLQEKNIDVSAIHLSGNRIGTYYLPQGADLKNAGVLYDRAHSSFSELKPGMIDWNKALEGCSWFHFSAISPALNSKVAVVCQEALKVATAKGLIVSVDLNYRSKLWQYGKAPQAVMPPLVNYCHVIMGNIWAAEALLGIEAPINESHGRTKEELKDAARQSMAQLQQQYPAATTFAYTFRMEETYWAVLQQHRETVISDGITIRNVVDKAGSGDCFMAGFIYGLCHQLPSQQIIHLAVTAATGKLYEKGDATHQPSNK